VAAVRTSGVLKGIGIRGILIRRAIQIAFFGGTLWLALGRGRRVFEAFCPFGGAEAAWALFREKAYTCTLSEMNVAMGIAVAGLTLLAGKLFCSWICPVGFLHEILYSTGRTLRIAALGTALTRGGAHLPRAPRWPLIPRAVDRWLRLLRYPFTLVMLVLTWRAGELILRGYDPFFLLFSGFGHGALGIVSWVFLGLLLTGALIVPMLWCRYLCPLSALMDLLGRFGILRVHRDEQSCTSCGACDRACLQRLAVADRPSVAAADCTRCLDCLDACPEDALHLRAGLPDPRTRRSGWGRLRPWMLPAPAAAAVFLGVRLADPLTLPTATASFRSLQSLASPAVATCTVDGVKCRGTSNLFIHRVAAFDGVARVETYAGMHRVKLTFDRSRIAPEALRDSISAPVPHPQTGVRYAGIFTCTQMKVED
jgi:polyferredoxin